MTSSRTAPPVSRTSGTTPATGDDHDLLTLPHAAERLSISKRTLERLIAGGDFPRPVKIGRSARVTQGDIAAYLAKLCRERGDKISSS